MAINHYVDLKNHVGHKIECVQHDNGNNVALKCGTCDCILTSYNKPKKYSTEPNSGLYKVTVNRIGYSSKEIGITADSEQEAHMKAMEILGDFEYSEHDAEYEIEDISK